VARRSGLGKGLGALIPTDEIVEGPPEEGGLLREVPVDAVVANQRQPRQRFDDESLRELAASITELGVLQPILVRAGDDGTFELIAGERRWRASQLAGLATVPAVVRPADDVGSLEQALVENLHRDDLNPLEEAAAYQQLVDEFDFTQEQVASRVGKSRSAVANTVRLLQLPAPVQALVADGQLSAGHARALLATRDLRFQKELAVRAATEGLTVRQVEEAVRTRFGGEAPDEGEATPADATTPAAPVGRTRPAALLELEQLLSDHLETRVRVQMGAKKGKVEVEFADIEDLERIYNAMRGATV
jgi:ParB family chromosome partitioning protein